MVWIILAATAVMTWWNTRRYGRFLDNTISTVKKRLSEFQEVLDSHQLLAQEVVKQGVTTQELNRRFQILSGQVKSLLEAADHRSLTASQAAINQILGK